MRQSLLNRMPVWMFPLAAVIFVTLWQWATVTANYAGNWSALFCIGALQRQPPLNVSEHVYLFQNSTGYDGQFYRYIAHDPFLRSSLKTYVDDPRLRYQRILIPLLAYGFAFGESARVDRAYEFVFLLAIALGVYWSCVFVRNAGLAASWGLLFLAMPAIPISMDRLVVDGGLAALTAAFLYYSPSPSWKLFLVLACAALTRETGFLLLLAYCAYLAWRREFRFTGIFLLSGTPAIAWYAYVRSRTIGMPYQFSLIPFSAILRVLGHPWKYPAGTPLRGVVVVADYLAIAGVLLAFGLAFVCFARAPVDPIRITAALFSAMALVFQRTDHWQNVYDFGRVYTPVLLCLAAIAVRNRSPWLIAPVVMMLPRIAIQLAPQLLGVIHWMT